MDKLFVILGCSIFVLMGGVHLVWTMCTNKFEARDPQLTADMKRVSPVLTSRTSMWNAWKGFNASHSLGAIVFGLFFIIVALENYDYLKTSVALNVVLVIVPLSFLALAIKYWFDKPRNGILIGLSLILLSFVMRIHM
jgi:hypothetical protein